MVVKFEFAELMLVLDKAGIKMRVKDGQLHSNAPEGAITLNLRNQIHLHRDKIIKLLQNTEDYIVTSLMQSITKIEEQKSYPLSNAQRRLWILDQMEEEQIAYNMPAAIRLNGELDIQALEQSIQLLFQRHESIRTNFIEGRQVIHSSINFSLHLTDYTNVDNQTIQSHIRKHATFSFDLSKDALLKLELLQLGKEEHILLFNMHHIISDGWSMSILFKELATLYEACVAGIEQPLSVLIPLSIQYKDYAAWQNELLTSEQILPVRDYWLKTLAPVDGMLPVLELPTDYPRPVIKTYNGASSYTRISPVILAKLNQLSQAKQATLFMSLTALVKVLLYRYSGQRDILIGSPSAGRNHPDLNEQIGYYLNTLVLRNQIDPSDNFITFLDKVKINALAAFENELYPFDKLVEELNLPRDTSRSPVFDVLLILQNNETVPFKLGEVDISYEKRATTTSKFDLTFNFAEREEGLYLNIGYNTDLFKRDSIQRLLTHFETLLESVLVNPNALIDKLTILPTAERQLLLEDFNDTKTDFPQDKTLIDLFEEQVEKTPNNIAVVFEERQLTYRELNEKANQVGHYLRSTYAIQADDIIALQLERSEWMIIAILGVLKSGAAYLPIDPDFPIRRIEYMLEDSQAKVLLSDEATAAASQSISVELSIEIIQHIKSDWKQNLPYINTSSHLAYIIYTSGTTGHSKGTMIEHRGAINFAYSLIIRFRVSSEDIILQFSNFTFDAFIGEFLFTFLSGATLLIIPKEILFMKKVFLNLIKRYQVSFAILPPAFLADFPNKSFDSLRALITVGEKPLLRDMPIYQQAQSYFNAYGPTEYTVCICAFEVPKKFIGTNVPIGQPIANTQIVILDKELQLVPIGVSGELCVSGSGLARGYLNNPQLTEEKFIPHPFRQGERLYKTGDLARWLPDGNIEFLGRIDNQLKIRGYRIEAGEIEQALLTHPSIQAAVVIGHEVAGQKELVAYLVPTAIERSEEALEQSEAAVPDMATLRSFLAKGLPDYMLPTYFVLLDSLPLTASGKVSRKALPSPDADSLASGTTYEGPRTPVEQTLVDIWEELLVRQPIGIHDNFFTIGGHSLRAIRLVALIQQQLGAKLKLTQIFTHSTIAQLAQEVSKLAALPPSLLRSIRAIETAESYTLSNAQRRLWVLDQMEEEQIAYNMPAAIRLKGELDIQALEQSIQLLFQRHESLRTNFVEGRQVIHATINYSLGLTDYSNSDKQTIQSHIRKHGIFPFDLSKDALLQLELLQVSEAEHLLLFNMHHIISDGWSMGILFKELTALYEACMARMEQPLSVLTPLSIQYKDYAAWQNELLTSEEILPARDYWLQTLAPVDGLLPVLELPTDYPRPSLKTYNGASVYTRISPDLLAKLNQLSQSKQATLFMSLTALVKILLYRYSGQRDIIIGSPIAGRNHPDLNDQIGFYVNTLVLRNQIDPRDSFVSFLDQVKTNALAAFENDLYPFDKLVEELNLPRDTSRSAVFDVMLILQNNEVVPFTLGELDINYERRTATTSKFDLTFNFEEREESLYLKIGYNTDLFKRDRIQRLVTHFETLLESVLVNPTSLIEELNILPHAERQLLLEDFNDTKVDFPRDKTIIDLFEEQVEKTPNNIAIVFEDKQWTYQQLNQLTNQIAHYLIDNYAIQSDEVIALLPERSQWMPIGILAILKTGAAYLPLSKDLPSSRLAFMIKDSGAKLLLTDAANENLGKQIFSPILLLEKIQTEKIHNPNPIVIPSNLAFVLYTSGSTGKPKGVMMPHQAMVNLMCWNIEYSPLAIGSRTTQFASFLFDASFHEIFATWLSGGELVMVGEAIKKDLFAFADLIVKEQIERLFLPFAALQELAIILLNHQGDLSHLKVIQTAGEQLQISEAIIQLFKRLPNCRLENHYGPTETHVVSAYTLKGDPDSWMPLPPIGQPIANTQLYILDKSLTLVPIGVTGELYIGGAGLAHGYLNLPDLSKERFIVHPFRQGERLYKTGDLARWLPDGNIEFLGRIDNQLKIRGYRIEAGEIEQALLAHPAIQSVVVIGHEAKDTKELVAYLVPTAIEKDQEAVENLEQSIPNISMLRSFLSESLPDYMIPAYYVQLDTLPLTASGKINRKAIHSPDQISLVSGIVYEAPRTPIQQILVELWAELLNRSSIGIHDNFFDLGGHSLRAIRLVALIQQQLSVKIKLTQIFTQPTIAALAKLIELPEEISLLQDIKLTTEEQEKTIKPTTTEIEW